MRTEITFQSDGITLAGHLHMPDGAGAGRPVPALVCSGPFTGVKEQVTGLYAERLAARGVAVLAFDHRNWGASGGSPRQHESAEGKLRDLADALTWLQDRKEIARDRVGALGVCLGASYVLRFAAFDPRVKAIALVAGAYNDPWAMRDAMGAETYRERLRAFAETAARQARTGDVEYIKAVTDDGGRAAMPGGEPFAYYGTARAASPGWTNRVTALSVASLVTLQARFAADFVSPTPVLVVHGKVDAFCSPESAKKTFDRMGEPKKLVWLETTNHIELYDDERYVGPAVDAVAAHFAEHL